MSNILMGFKGPTQIDTGYIYAPIVPGPFRTVIIKTYWDDDAPKDKNDPDNQFYGKRHTR